MPNAFAHIELNTDDVQKAKKFYKALFDWKITDMPAVMHFDEFDVGGGTGGGIQAQTHAGGTQRLGFRTSKLTTLRRPSPRLKKPARPLHSTTWILVRWGRFGVFHRRSALGVWQKPGQGAPKASSKKASKKKASSRKWRQPRRRLRRRPQPKRPERRRQARRKLPKKGDFLPHLLQIAIAAR